MSNLVNNFFQLDANTTRETELAEIIDKANHAYRFTDTPIMSDAEFDELVDELTTLNSKHPMLLKIGVTIPDSDSRKEKLPIHMASMNKLKSLDAIGDWMMKKSIDKNTLMCITPKFDGLSLLNNVCDEKHAWTRGDGIIGQNSDKHFADIWAKYTKPDAQKIMKEIGATYMYTAGEAIMHRNIFNKRYSKENGGKYENGRNTVSGMLGAAYDPKFSKALRDTLYQRYSLMTDVQLDKNLQLDILNKYFNAYNPVKYKLMKFSEMTTEILNDLFNDWKQAFEIDGLIIEVNDAKLRSKLGLETSTNNPCFARAYKANFEEVGETEVTDFVVEVSKLGYLIPVAKVKPIRLDGATVTKATVNNMRQVIDMKIGIGSIVKIIRSGSVIPLITTVVKTAKYDLPTKCPSCKSNLVWNDTDTHLMCTNDDCGDKKLKEIVSFFSIMASAGVKEGTCTQLYDFGYDSLEKIFTAKEQTLTNIPGIGGSKAKTIVDAVEKIKTESSLSKIQHASNLFKGLGSKKLKLLEHFITKPNLNDVVAIAGFQDKSAQVYIDNYDKFFAWAKKLNITIKLAVPKTTNKNGKFYGQQVVFTGIRRADLEDYIVKEGGDIGGGVSKHTTILVMKEIGSGSAKETKANALGVKIMQINNFEKLCK